MRVIVSDTSPICYLVLIGEAALIGKLYHRILIPDVVYSELQQERTPELVRAWLETAHESVEVISMGRIRPTGLVSSHMHPGELAAIDLALDLKADLLLMDDRSGAEEARRLGLQVTGTLGILARGAERGFVDLREALKKLQSTSFRATPELIQQILDSSKSH